MPAPVSAAAIVGNVYVATPSFQEQSTTTKPDKTLKQQKIDSVAQASLMNEDRPLGENDFKTQLAQQEQRIKALELESQRLRKQQLAELYTKIDENLNQRIFGICSYHANQSRLADLITKLVEYNDLDKATEVTNQISHEGYATSSFGKIMNTFLSRNDTKRALQMVDKIAKPKLQQMFKRILIRNNINETSQVIHEISNEEVRQEFWQEFPRWPPSSQQIEANIQA